MGLGMSQFWKKWMIVLLKEAPSCFQDTLSTEYCQHFLLHVNMGGDFLALARRFCFWWMQTYLGHTNFVVRQNIEKNIKSFLLREPANSSLVEDRLLETQKSFHHAMGVIFSLVCFNLVYLFALEVFFVSWGRVSGEGSCLFAFIFKDFRIYFFSQDFKLKEF